MIAHAMDPERREQIERAMADPERCMPSERAALEAQGFVAKTERIEPGEGIGGVSGSAARPANLPVFPEGTLPVNECFVTIQGEGHHVGKPSCFIRLQGCPVGCPWCDTRHSWVVDETRRMDARDLLATKTESSDTWAPMSVDLLVTWISGCRPRHVVLTGGEPCMYDLRPLSEALIDRGCSVQVETSGTHEVRISSRAWVTVAPKIGMPGGFSVRADAIARASEIKMPIGKPADLEVLFRLLDEDWHRPETPIYLAPLSLSKKATELCVQACIANGFRLSLQTHQLIGVR